ncbi:hypothetical protein [Lacrimispora sp.]|uniref:hypothetical protein n=1 Tax=Lacrimispora sp. TaxID=2719234 RepID=UPI0032E4EDE5
MVDIITNIIAALALFVALISFAYTWITNTKKYELTDQFRNNLLGWYEETTSILIHLKLVTEFNCINDTEKCEMLSKLSTQIELGRFYFPNIDKGDSFGEDKPSAYQGYRHIALEFLVFSYNIYLREDANRYIGHATELQRHFTSYIYELLNPQKYNKDVCKYTTVTFNKDIVLEEFLKQDPLNYIFYC